MGASYRVTVANQMDDEPNPCEMMTSQRDETMAQDNSPSNPKWIVKAFDRETLVGIVSFDGAELKFHSTSFQSNTTFRFPRIGEPVDLVTTSSGALLSIHGE
jgi:hypothetical protein